jgi:hypothetical protein
VNPTHVSELILLIYQKTKSPIDLLNNNEKTNRAMAKMPSKSRYQNLNPKSKEVFLLCK